MWTEENGGGGGGGGGGKREGLAGPSLNLEDDS